MRCVPSFRVGSTRRRGRVADRVRLHIENTDFPVNFMCISETCSKTGIYTFGGAVFCFEITGRLGFITRATGPTTRLTLLCRSTTKHTSQRVQLACEADGTKCLPRPIVERQRTWAINARCPPLDNLRTMPQSVSQSGLRLQQAGFAFGATTATSSGPPHNSLLVTVKP